MDYLFFTFSQNNSGGYFVIDDTVGLSEYVIVQAKTAKKAWKKLKIIIDSSTQNAWSYCNCCGERWYNSNDDSDGETEPCIYGTPVNQITKEGFRNQCHVHYSDGTLKKIEFKEKQSKN